MLNNNISSTCPRSMVNFGPLTAEIGWRVRGIPANFDMFRILVSLLHCHRSAEVNQTLHGVSLFPVLVHYIHFWELLPPNGILPGAKFILHPSLAFYIGSVTAWHSSSGCPLNFVVWYLHTTGHPLCSTLGG